MNEKLASALEVTAQTNPGVVRSHNEDSVATREAVGLVVLADGMGGYNAGEVASGMATTLLASELERAFSERSPSQVGAGGTAFAHTALAQEIARANGAIYQAARSQPQYAGMGTTLVTAVFHNNSLTVGHLGDSRLYRLRNGEFETITRDHSLLQEQIDAGLINKEQARLSQNKNLVTKALGVDPEVEPSIQTLPVQVGDIYLLCSDGLNDMVEDEEIGMTLGMLAANLPLCASQLIELANDNGGRDNVSVILVKIKGDFAEETGFWARVQAFFASWFK
ncbi:MAG: Stp1/IreP family PP2C-type Ser/Thr phosphatase [Rhodocyclaceae bacterium]|jgi:serine/threonine protein phosphatase PrpC|nr:Stp1/IreP family PP2C-type Ser/Thr phosphatase [Rhodocyclaceae bacterium]MBK6906760.1 Stp1/IreP family PP2C-type Ser/Thr phosphatase [Rhodocyclaceae bacterium]